VAASTGLLTPDEAAKVLGMSRRTLDEHMRATGTPNRAFVISRQHGRPTGAAQ
jgi:predicted DNA-binding transcriptional regulator AlpA